MRAEAMAEKTRIENEAYGKRVEYLKKMISSEDKVERARWRQNLPQLPEWKLRRKRKRENRRQEEEEESSRKRRKCEARSSRSRSASDEEKSTDGSDIESAYSRTDEPAPRCKRILSEKARKKKKGKK